VKKLGPQHPGVAASYNDLGKAYRRKGDYDRAIECFQEALKIGLKRFGKGHPYTKIYQRNLDSVK
jgi:tetratricopeptide (TPR) repeat protein